MRYGARGAPVVAAAIVLALASACSSTPPPAAHDRPSASRSTQQPSNDAPVTSPCEDAQLAVLRERYPGRMFANLAQDVLTRAQGRSAKSARIWRRLATAAATQMTAGGCSPSETHDVLPAPGAFGGSIDQSELIRLVAATRRWITRIDPHGRNRLAGDMRYEMYCLRNRARFANVSYKVMSTPTPAGRDVWLVLYIHNKTMHGMLGEIFGDLDIVGNIGPTPGHMEYGDENWTKRHATVGHMVGDVGGHRFHLTSAGHLAHIHLWELLYVRHRPTCNYAVARR